MVKRILALSLLMVGLAGCGSGGGAESEPSAENTAQILGEGATPWVGCHYVCETNANGTTYSAFGNDISICYAYKRCDNYTECMSGCAE